MPHRYSALVFDLPLPRFRLPEQAFELQPGLNLRRRTGQLLENDVFWESELGRSAWLAINREHELVLSNELESARADVVGDPEHIEMEKQLTQAFVIIPLVGEIRSPFSTSYLFSGVGRAEEGILAIENVRSVSPLLTAWRTSMYQEVHWDEYNSRYSALLDQHNFLESWRDVLTACRNHLFGGQPFRQLTEAYRSFSEGTKANQLEFRIPNFVRAMEAICTPRREPEFIDRYIHLLAPTPGAIGCVDQAEVRQRLSDLYRLRNDCVHGKPFGYKYRTQHGQAINEDQIARLEYIAEWGARRAILGAFQNLSLHLHLGDFDTLETAWRQNQIDPHTDFISRVC